MAVAPGQHVRRICKWNRASFNQVGKVGLVSRFLCPDKVHAGVYAFKLIFSHQQDILSHLFCGYLLRVILCQVYTYMIESETFVQRDFAVATLAGVKLYHIASGAVMS